MICLGDDLDVIEHVIDSFNTQQPVIPAQATQGKYYA